MIHDPAHPNNGIASGHVTPNLQKIDHVVPDRTAARRRWISRSRSSPEHLTAALRIRAVVPPHTSGSLLATALRRHPSRSGHPPEDTQILVARAAETRFELRNESG